MSNMKSIRILSSILGLLVAPVNLGLAAETQAEPQKQKPLLALDNYGGYSHGGRRVTVFVDNSYEQVSYTDMIGDQKLRRGKCSLDLTAGTLHLDNDKQDGEQLFRVKYEEKDYW